MDRRDWPRNYWRRKDGTNVSLIYFILFYFVWVELPILPVKHLYMLKERVWELVNRRTLENIPKLNRVVMQIRYRKQ